MTISNFAPANAGSYDVVVRQPRRRSHQFTAVSVLTFTASKPVITVQPVTQFAVAGATVDLNVTAIGKTSPSTTSGITTQRLR